MATAAKKADSKKAEAPKLVEGVVMQNVKEDMLDKSLKQLKLPTNGDAPQKVARLVGYFDAQEKAKKDLYQCDNCKGYSTEEWKFCPYCGLEGDVDTTPQPPAKKEKPAAIVLKGPDGKRLTPLDLDESVKQINVCKNQWGVSAWQLGQALKENHDRELWKLRVDEEGAPKYTNVKQFWKEEVGLTHPWAYKLMEVAAGFTSDGLQELGVSKAWLILKAPETARPKLLKAAKAGATRGDLEDAVKKLADKGGSTAGGSGVPADKRLTIAVMPKRHTIKLYKRKKKATEVSAPAKRLADDPHGQFLTETAAFDFKVSKDKAGEWVLMLSIRKI